MRDGRSHSVESSQCLVFGVNGRSLFHFRRSVIRNNKGRSRLGDRTPYNHRSRMVEMDKIVSGKRGWVSLRQPNRQVRAIELYLVKFRSLPCGLRVKVATAYSMAATLFVDRKALGSDRLGRSG
jgi:hypothetical protein